MAAGFSQKNSLENWEICWSTVRVSFLLKNQWQVRLNNCNKNKKKCSAGRKKKKRKQTNKEKQTKKHNSVCYKTLFASLFFSLLQKSIDRFLFATHLIKKYTSPSFVNLLQIHLFMCFLRLCCGCWGVSVTFSFSTVIRSMDNYP